MKIIEEMSNYIEEEIEDAEKYIKCAMKYKETDPVLAKVFSDISSDEMKHMILLHDQVAQMINRYKAEKGEPPADMLAVYNYLHERHIEKANAVKVMQSTFKGN